MSLQRPLRVDLLAPSGIRRALLWPGFPVVLQAAALVAVVALAANGWGIGPGHSAKDLLTLRKTNLTTLVVWGLWWPGMIALALAFGRAWCTVCPMELVNRATDALARRAGWPRARLPKLLGAGGVVLLAYLVLQILVAGVSVHRVPHLTSLLLVSLLGLAAVAGLVFEHPRAFCTALCPAAALLSVYGRFTRLQLDVRSRAVCDGCRTRDCVAQRNRFELDGRSCPSLIRPHSRRPSDGCVLCFQCTKVCPHANVGFGIVEPEAGSRAPRMLLPFEAAFVMIAAGFVAHEVVGEVKWLDRYFHFVPDLLHAWAPAVGFGWWEALWFLFLLPVAVWCLVAGIARLLGHRTGLGTLLLAAATGAAPVVAMAHLAKALAKITSWAGYLPLAAADPAGELTFSHLAEGAVARPAGLVGLSLVGWIALVAMLWIGWRGWQWARDAAPEGLLAARAGLATVGLLFTVVLGVWCWS